MAKLGTAPKKLTLIGAVLFFCFVCNISLAQDELVIRSAGASSILSSAYQARYAIDKKLSTSWRGKGNQTFWWLRLNLDKAYSLSQISIWWDNTYCSTNYSIQGSNDALNWTNILSGLSSKGGKTNPYKVTHPLSGVYRYVRIYINKAQKQYPVIYEVKLYGAPPYLSISVDPKNWDIKEEVKISQTVTMGTQNKISVTNNGNITETFTLALINPPGWTAFAQPGVETYVLSGLFCNITDTPQKNNFNQDGVYEDTLTIQPKKATSTIFGYATATANGASAPRGAVRHLYLQFMSPTRTDKTKEQEISVIVSCQTP